jgi:histidinol-phosphatase (PHP family)
MHTRFSDGKGEPRDFVEQALAFGFDAIGFSEHSPLPFDNTFALKASELDEYTSTIRTLGKAFEPEIKVFLSMEMDFIPGYSENFEELKRLCGLDYTIGSVHLVVSPAGELWFIDGPVPEIYDDGLNFLFGGDIRKAVTAYFHQTNQMIETQKPDIIGHMDKIKMHNKERFFREDETWYNALVNETLDLISQKGTIVEINTRGIYKKRSATTYPGIEIIRKLNELAIPVLISSDAHLAEELNGAFNEAYLLLKEAGVKETVYFNGKDWSQTSV